MFLLLALALVAHGAPTWVLLAGLAWTARPGVLARSAQLRVALAAAFAIAYVIWQRARGQGAPRRS